jgi:hypothetical protein
VLPAFPVTLLGAPPQLAASKRAIRGRLSNSQSIAEAGEDSAVKIAATARFSDWTEASNASVRISRAALLEIQSLLQDCKSDGTALWALKGEIAARPVALLAAMPGNIPDTAMRVAITKRIVKARNPPRTRRMFVSEDEDEGAGAR